MCMVKGGGGSVHGEVCMVKVVDKCMHMYIGYVYIQRHIMCVYM